MMTINLHPSRKKKRQRMNPMMMIMTYEIILNKLIIMNYEISELETSPEI